MPFTFVEIERKTTSVIGPLFLALVAFYFLTGYLVLCVALNAFCFFSSCRLQPFAFSLPRAEWTAYVLLGSLLVGLGHWAISTRNVVERLCQALGSRPYDRQDGYHAVARAIVDEVSVACGGIPIELEIIPTAAANAFALADFQGRSVIGLTEGLLCRLNRSQLEAVIAHEAGHIISGDCRDTTLTCSLGEIYEQIHAGIFKVLKGVRRHGVFSLVLLLVAAVIGIMNLLSRLLRCFISRQRELRADALAVRLTRDPQSLAQALSLVGAHRGDAGAQANRLQSIFIVNPSPSLLDEQPGFFADLFSSHPPMRRRLDVLLEMVRMSPEDLQRELEAASRQPLSVHGACTTDGRQAGQCCPRCRQPLTEESYEAAVLLRCPGCGGSMLPQEVLRRILLRRGAALSEETRRMYELLRRQHAGSHLKDPGPAARWQLLCPRCGGQMRCEAFNYSYPVAIDRCVSCGWLWLDHLELELLQYIYEHKEEFFRHE